MLQLEYGFRFLLLITLLLTAGATCNLVEKCQKDFRIGGKVTDEYKKPISGVEVIVGDAVIAITGADGKYSYELKKTQTWFAGRNLKLRKKGYRSVASPVFSKAESGPNVCGAVNLERDVILAAE